MLKKTVLIGALALLSSALAGTAYLFYREIPKTAYINTQQLYDQFAMKHELEKKYSQTENARKVILDSLQQDLIALSTQMQQQKGVVKTVSERFNVSQENYVTLQARFEQDNLVLSQKYSDEIWTRINLYVKEYGERNGYTYIYGANGGGSLMFAADAHDITFEVSDYINKRYQGDLK